MNTKQTVFVNEYLKCFNATRAAIAAGYSEKTARSIGAENLTKPDIKAEITARLEALTMSADEVLVRLTEQARGDMSEFLRFEDGVRLPFLDLKAANEKGLLRLVKKFKYNTDGHPEIELYDAQAAMKAIRDMRGFDAPTKQQQSGEVTLRIVRDGIQDTPAEETP